MDALDFSVDALDFSVLGTCEIIFSWRLLIVRSHGGPHEKSISISWSCAKPNYCPWRHKSLVKSEAGRSLWRLRWGCCSWRLPQKILTFHWVVIKMVVNCFQAWLELVAVSSWHSKQCYKSELQIFRICKLILVRALFLLKG